MYCTRVSAEFMWAFLVVDLPRRFSAEAPSSWPGAVRCRGTS